MRIAIFGKYPPIQGGTSAQTYVTAHNLAKRGHNVIVITTAQEVELSCRQMFLLGDTGALERQYPNGGVTVYNTSSVRPGNFIPWAQPFASKLFGLGMKVLHKHDVDLIVGWYMEPYGLVAAQIAQATSKPLMLRHAGSDIGRLAKHPDLREAYKWAFGLADRVLTAPVTKPVLAELGVQDRKMMTGLGWSVPDYFFEQRQPLDLDLVSVAAADWYHHFPLNPSQKRTLIEGLANTIDPSLPSLGIYGKVGASKGSYDLLAALELLLQQGIKFNVIAISGGQPELFGPYLQELGTKHLLSEHMVTLPFLAQWRIPAYLDLLDVVCFLERDFAIGFHGPKVALEALSAGTALICSAEVADKQYYRDSLIDGRNYYRVDDPKCHLQLSKVLAEALTNRDNCQNIAGRGTVLGRHLWETAPVSDGHADAIEKALGNLA